MPSNSAKISLNHLRQAAQGVRRFFGGIGQHIRKTIRNTIDQIERNNMEAQLSQYSAVYTAAGVGPHSVNKAGTTPKRFQTRDGRIAYACQIDCMSLLDLSARLNTAIKSPLFRQCKNRYYSYGAYQQFGCKDMSVASKDSIQLAIQLCVRYSGCIGQGLGVGAIASSLDVASFQTAQGVNTGPDGTKKDNKH
jgi:hypothetical protein